MIKERRINVVDHNAEWARRFESEKALLRNSLGDLVVNIHHIGSTSVPGLAAKPIIDLLMEVEDLKELDASGTVLISLGYTIKGENGIKGRRYFQKGGVLRSHHLHAFKSGDPNLIRHLAFRDYMIAFPEIAEEYSSLKKEAASRSANDAALYASFKNDFIIKHEKLALQWYDERSSLHNS